MNGACGWNWHAELVGFYPTCEAALGHRHCEEMLPRYCKHCGKPVVRVQAPETCEWAFDGFGRMPHWHPMCEPRRLASDANPDGTCLYCKKPIVYKGTVK